MGSKYLQEPDINIVGNEIGLFDDIALYIKDRNKPPEYKIARVIRMRNQGRATIEYRRLVSLDNTDKYPNRNVLVNMYKRVVITMYIQTQQKILNSSFVPS